LDFVVAFPLGASVEDVLEAIRCCCDELGEVTGTGRPGVVTSEVVDGGGGESAAMALCTRRTGAVAT
jgi:hypothetical protein